MSIDKIMNLVDLVGTQQNWNKYIEKLINTLPSHLKKDHQRYVEMYTMLARNFLKNPYISNKMSILTCMYNAPALGLNPDPVFGHIYFVPYKGILTYQIGYKGMIKLSYNTGEIRSIRASLVYENDDFDYYENEKGQHFLHRPKFGNRGKEICGYSIFEDKEGIPHFHVMESQHIDSIKKLVLARMKGKQSPWTDPLFEPEMRKKTVIRRHWKTEPMSVEIAGAIHHEENTENGIVSTPEEIQESISNIIENTDIPIENTDIPIESEVETVQQELDTEFTSKL